MGIISMHLMKSIVEFSKEVVVGRPPQGKRDLTVCQWKHFNLPTTAKLKQWPRIKKSTLVLASTQISVS